jgi:hypothetical protein
VQNRRMVAEMAANRALSVRPHLVLELHPFGPAHVDIRLHNVGPGAVHTDVSVGLEFVRVGGQASEQRSFVASVFPLGSHHDFGVPRDVSDAEDLATKVQSIALHGQAQDIYGNQIDVADQISNVRDWWDRTVKADLRFAPAGRRDPG